MKIRNGLHKANCDCGFEEPCLEYLLQNVILDPPSERERAIKAGNTGWPEGFWGVSDENSGYVAYFAFEEDAVSFRFALIASRMGLSKIADRYGKRR